MANPPAQWLLSHPIAHRGLHTALAPENSLQAFSAAVEAHFAIELDVHCTSDNKIVVFHDDDTLRLTGTKGKVRRSKSSALQQLRLQGTESRIPLLSEVFDVVNGKVPLLIEVKAGTRPTKICPLLLRLIESYEGDVAVQSFDPFIVGWFRKHAPSVLCGQLSCNFRGERMLLIQKVVLKNMIFNARTHPDFIAFDVADMPSKAVLYWLKRHHVPLLLWTVKSEDDRLIAQKYNANIIFENAS